MNDFGSSEWSDLPENITVNDILSRLNDVITIACTCGGSDYDDEGACPACLIWHTTLQRMSYAKMKEQLNNV